MPTVRMDRAKRDKILIVVTPQKTLPLQKNTAALIVHLKVWLQKANW
jgi:hypothetical protein